jgi:hypothetical protein
MSGHGKATTTTLNLLQLTRFTLGAIYLAFPARAASAIGAGEPGTAAVRVARVLGARHAAQALATTGHPPGTVLALGAGVDAAHAASMLALAVISPRWRRPAVRDGLIAATLAGVGVAAARSVPPPHGPPSPRDQWAGWLAERLTPDWYGTRFTHRWQ